MKSIKNIKIGDKAGKLTLIDIKYVIGGNNRERKLLYCICDCGTKLKPIRPSDFGNKTSCGCKDKERLHYKAHTKIWRAWQGMKKRCYNVNDPKYSIYGAIGRFVCDGLKKSKHFFKILGEPPTKAHSLDREDNNGSYTCGICEDCIKNNYPLNVRWATASQQSNNVKTNVIVTYKGKEMTLVNASREAKLPYKTVHHRIALGWGIEDALNTPLKRVRLIYNGKFLYQIAKENNMSKAVLYSRVKHQGMALEEALLKPVLKRSRKNGKTKK